MIVYVRYGTRLSGKVDKFAGSYIATRFFHIYWVPLIPLGSWLVFGNDSGVSIPLNGRSVAAAYLRGLGTIGALVAGIGLLGFLANDYRHVSADNFVEVLLFPLALVAAAAFSWVWLGRLSKDDKAQRVIYWDSVGHFIDPARLGDARHALIEKLRKDVQTRAQALHSGGYREAYDPETAWRKIATAAEMTDGAFLKQALTLTRLEWSFATGTHRHELARDHATIFANIKRTNPEALSADTYNLR